MMPQHRYPWEGLLVLVVRELWPGQTWGVVQELAGSTQGSPQVEPTDLEKNVQISSVTAFATCIE